jgi:hypothetical protein
MGIGESRRATATSGGELRLDPSQWWGQFSPSAGGIVADIGVAALADLY